MPTIGHNTKKQLVILLFDSNFPFLWFQSTTLRMCRIKSTFGFRTFLANIESTLWLVNIWSKDAPAKSNTTIPGHCNSLSNEADYIKASTILHVHRLPGPHRRITLIPHGKKHGESNTLFAYQLMIFFRLKKSAKKRQIESVKNLPVFCRFCADRAFCQCHVIPITCV